MELSIGIYAAELGRRNNDTPKETETPYSLVGNCGSM